VAQPQGMTRSHRRSRLLGCVVGAAALAAAIAPAAAARADTAVSTMPAASTAGSPVLLHKVGTVDLSALAKADAGRSAAASPSARHRLIPLGLPPADRAAKATRLAATAGALTGFGSGNVTGEHGFDGITAAINAAANSPLQGGAGDVSPPDQGLAVGPSSAGTAIVEFVNDSLNIYSPSGKTLLGAVPSYQVFDLPSDYFLSDPRAYWDAQTGHWFLTQFTSGTLTNGTSNGLADQYIAVSQTTSPFGPYTVFSFDTSDASAAGCPCFGDYDQVGLNNSGLYITTNEFGQTSGAFNGSVVYAASKSRLITAAQGNGPTPAILAYHVAFASDPFGSYHLSPSTVTQGSSSPDTEYFVESNANSNYGSGLTVYALLDTAILNAGGRPALVKTTVPTESYSSPPNAYQKSGPFPYGQSLGQTGVAQLQTDFDAVQEVTYASGQLYAELSTGFNYGTGQNAGAAWFVLHPSAGASSVSVKLTSDGYVKTSQELLYPVIGVNASGHGYMNFAVSSTSRYPSAGYVAFNGTSGPAGEVHIAAGGTDPLDDFTCYPPISSGQCRYGDYSMAQNYNGKIYMASEYIAPEPRDVLANWGTRIWDAPVP
jgi:hypothetical protein